MGEQASKCSQKTLWKGFMGSVVGAIWVFLAWRFFMLSYIPFVRPEPSWPIPKSLSNSSVEWIKDILLVKSLIFLTGSFSSLSLPVSFSDGVCWIFSLSMSSESSESI